MKECDSPPIFWSIPVAPIVWIYAIDLERFNRYMAAQDVDIPSLVVENGNKEMLGVMDNESNGNDRACPFMRQEIIPPEAC
jgi:hypothetical protein